MWELFKDKNEYNEKNIIGFLSFALMCVFGVVDLVMGIIGIELLVNDYIYNSFVWITLGSFGIAGAEKVYKKWGNHYLGIAQESQMVQKKLDKVWATTQSLETSNLKNTTRKNIEDKVNEI